MEVVSECADTKHVGEMEQGKGLQAGYFGAVMSKSDVTDVQTPLNFFRVGVGSCQVWCWFAEF